MKFFSFRLETIHSHGLHGNRFVRNDLVKERVVWGQEQGARHKFELVPLEHFHFQQIHITHLLR